jgi:dolichyl-phosphate-mannose-protein mannosyltransferase
MERTVIESAAWRFGALQRLLARMSRIGFLPAAAVVAIVAGVNFLGGLGYPPHPIWDESYYLTAVERYEEHIAQFASHPPLGIALITAGDALLDPNRGIDTRHVGWDKKISGDELPKGYSFAGVRLAPGVFGVIGAVLFFALMHALTRSISAALAFSNLYVFENAFIVHFRAGHLDPFQLAFVIGALLCFVVSARRGARSSPALELTFGICCGLAMLVKANAVVVTLLGAMLVARRIALGWRTVARGRLLLTALRDGLVMAAGCLAAIALVMTIHVAINPQPPVAASPAGKKDLGFISPTYLAYLHHERPLSPAVVLAASRDYLHFVTEDFEGVPKSDPNGSRALEWPLHRGTINYRWDSTGPRTAYVQLTGNVVGWAIGLAALIGALALTIRWSLARSAPSGPPRAASGGAPDPARRALLVMLLLQYLVYMAVHAYIGLERVVYLYHYFIALVITFCLVPLVWQEAMDRWPVLRERRAAILGAMAILLWAGFIFYAPLTFHWYLTPAQCEWRNVLQHVVHCNH